MVNTSASMEPTTRFRRYRFDQLVEGTLYLDQESSSLVLLRDEQLVELQHLSPSEFFVVESLFDNYPDYCPYAHVLHAMTGKRLDKCVERVNWGIDNNAVDVVMRPVRNLLGRVREKLFPFDIQVKSLINMGYMLVPVKSGIRRQA